MSNDFKVNRLKEEDSIYRAIHLRAAYAIWESQGKRVSGIKEFTGIDDQADYDGKDFTIWVFDPNTKEEIAYTVDVKFRYVDYPNDVMLCAQKSRDDYKKTGWAFDEEKKNDAILYIRERFQDAIWISKKDLIKNRKRLMNEGSAKSVDGKDDYGSYTQHNTILKEIDLFDICPNSIKANYV